MGTAARAMGRSWGGLMMVVLFGFLMSACGKTAANPSATTKSTTAASPLAAAIQGQFVMVKLAYNEQVFGVKGKFCAAPCFDVGGWSMDPTDSVWPTTSGPVTVKGIPIWFPPTGNGTTAVQSAVNFGPQHSRTAKVPVPPGKYSTVYLLEGAGNGNHHAVLTFTYSNGSTSTAQMFVDDWCTSSPQGGVTAFQSARLTDKGTPQSGSPCAVFLATVPVSNTTGTMTSITFTQAPGTSHQQFEPQILAITLKQA